MRVAGTVELASCAARIDLGEGPSAPDAMIVLDDARLAQAVEGALWAACAGAGALAGSLKRVYVVASRYEEFLEALVRGAGELTPGDPLAAETQVGPLAGEVAAATLEAAIAQAVALGGEIHCGGRRDGTLFAPFVLSGVGEGAALLRERVAGPVLVVTAVSEAVEAAALANAPSRSLGASIWSSDRRRAVRIARELQARVVWGNDHVPALPLREAAAALIERCGRAQLITWEAGAGTAAVALPLRRLDAAVGARDGAASLPARRRARAGAARAGAGDPAQRAGRGGAAAAPLRRTLKLAAGAMAPGRALSDAGQRTAPGASLRSRGGRFERAL